MKKFLQKICLTVVAFALLFSFEACNETFSFATDLVDHAVVTDAQYEFRASAAYGSQTCGMEVSCNGILLAGQDGVYTASLSKGENEIVLAASSGSRSESRRYIVEYRNEFLFSDNLEEAFVRDGVLRFSASATFNGEPCAIAVSCNGEEGMKEGETFCVRLTPGQENVVKLIARKDNYHATKEWNVHYDGFTIITDLEDRETGISAVDFRAAALYGDEGCDLVVYVNGEELEPVRNNRYSLVMDRGGVYEVELRATQGNMTDTKTFMIRYTDAPPEFKLLSIENGSEFRGSSYTFDVMAANGLGEKLKYEDYSFAADLDPDDGRDDFVALETEVAKVWDDDAKTSVNISFKKGIFSDCLGKPFLLRVTATAFEKSVSETFELTYVGADADGKIGEVVFSLEGFTIGCGYFLEPYRVPIYEGVPFAVTLTEIIEANGWTYRNTGTPESGFYLAAITGMDLEGNAVPDSLQDVMRKMSGYTFNETSLPRWAKLGEFDYTTGSGWMYSVNGSFPNYGFSNYFPQDGDVVRVQFTLALGKDIGGGSAVGGGSAGYIEFADYAPVMNLLAEIRSQDFYGKSRETYDTVIETITVWNAAQSLLNEQIGILKTFYGIEA